MASGTTTLGADPPAIDFVGLLAALRAASPATNSSSATTTHLSYCNSGTASGAGTLTTPTCP